MRKETLGRMERGYDRLLGGEKRDSRYDWERRRVKENIGR